MLIRDDCRIIITCCFSVLQERTANCSLKRQKVHEQPTYQRERKKELRRSPQRKTKEAARAEMPNETPGCAQSDKKEDSQNDVIPGAGTETNKKGLSGNARKL